VLKVVKGEETEKIASQYVCKCPLCRWEIYSVVTSLQRVMTFIQWDAFHVLNED